MKSKYQHFEKGDIIVTEPVEGYYGIAVVLDDGHRLELTPGRYSYPMCHIAITLLLYDHRPLIEEIDETQLKPLKFDRLALYKGEDLFLRTETLVHIYTTRNIQKLEVIGKVDPSLVYQDELPWLPDGKNHKCYLCGDVGTMFGSEAYLQWLKEQ